MQLMPGMDPRLDPRRRRGLRFETRVLLSAFAIALPGVLGFLLALYAQPARVWWPTLIVLVFIVTLVLAFKLRHLVVYPLHTLSNLLEALREGDYSLRGSRARQNDAIGDVVWEVNALSETLRQQRLRVEETLNLLSKVMSEIDMAVLTFDDRRALRLVNAAGARLLARPVGELIGRSAAELGMTDCLDIEHETTLKRSFPGASGRFGIRRVVFRQEGIPHELLVISDLSRALRQEERQAWQRLIRVLGHELNNSLAPIRSMAETLGSMVSREPLPEEWREDTRGGLNLIRDRADALSRFMLGYSALARLPAPERKPVALAALVSRATRWEQRLPVRLMAGEEVQVLADADQIEQALINLIKNAAEAMLALAADAGRERQVEVNWTLLAREVVIAVFDRGPGLASTENLFVPFFTTKPGGSGVGLVLARQVAEAHGGSLSLENRLDGPGCVARIRLPLLPIPA
jgi:two-component system, NtrC family, nitrogen regulation sensor histidine kinase NtrY